MYRPPEARNVFADTLVRKHRQHELAFYDFLDWFGLENDLPCNTYNTVSGLILDQLAHIPATGEKLEWNGFTFEIVDMDGARIDKILVSQKQQS